MIFNYVSAILMLVIGLGLTHLLGDLVYAFRDRKRTTIHWIPFAWAGIIFAEQMQFLWAIYELHDLVIKWTALDFMLMLALSLLLFVAGALVVPRDNEDGTDGWILFLENGRWSLALLILYDVLAYITNLVMFGESPFSLGNISNLVLAVLLVSNFFSRSKKIWCWGTIVFCIATGISIILLSPAVYR